MPPRLARLLAVLAAVVLVGAAFALRGALGDDDESPSAGKGNGRDDDEEPFRVACDDDLGAACEVLAARIGNDAEVEVETASQPFARLSAGEIAYDAWFTLDPWPAMVATTGQAGREVAVTSPVEVASARLAVIVAPDATECDETPTNWRCLLEPANPSVGIAEPGTASGGLMLAAAVAGLQGNTGFGIGDVTDEVGTEIEDFLGLLAFPRRASVADQAALMISSGNFSALVAPQARAQATANSAQGRQRDLAVVALEPAVTIGVTLVGIGPRGPDALDALRGTVTDQTVVEALAREGWTGPAGPTTGLPAPDVIFALQKELA